MQVYNSLTNQKEEFIPNEKGIIKMYICGPTVYDYIHIGNARPLIFFDVVKRYFAYLGYDVRYASNITDVDDKIILKAIDKKLSEKDIVDFYLKQFWLDYENLGCEKPLLMPKATEYIQQMISFIEDLILKEYAYNVNGNVYFRVNKIKDYGILSNQKIDNLDLGSRIEVEEKKESPNDFVLWKKTVEGIKWESPWGFGRPGWHTECVVMINDLFHQMIDIHGGGNDLKFPHHENEIAQSCASHNHHLAKYWMHVGRLGLDNVKMSKSLGNTILVKDLLNSIPFQAFRLFMLSTPYRQPITYSDEVIIKFNSEWQKIERTYILAYQDKIFFNLSFEESLSLDSFNEFMNDDFNTPNVITVIYETVKQINILMRSKKPYGAYYNQLTTILNLLGLTINLPIISEKTKELYHKWLDAKQNKDYIVADILKQDLLKAGIII